MNRLDSEQLNKAKKLAARNYSITVAQDRLTDGRLVYIVEHPELMGCMAQGFTLDEAINELKSATIDYIYFLLEDGLEVPAPANYETTTALDVSSRQIDFSWSHKPSSDLQDELDEAIERSNVKANRGKTVQFTAVS